MSEKKKRKTWCKDNMKRAIEACRAKEMGYLKASKVFDVPKGTLERYVKDENANVDIKMGRKSVIPEWVERKMVDYLVEMDRRYHGIRKRDVLRMAYDICEKNKVPHTFNVAKQEAGKKWLHLFMKRNPSISFRTPQGVSKSRLLGFTRENVNVFFDLYESMIKKFNIGQQQIYNCDETGVTIVQHKHTKVLSLKGKKRIGKVTAQERGKLITVVICMNATGVFVPPMLIFPRKNMKEELLEGAPIGTVAKCHPSGWIQADIFTDWLRHFIKITKPSAESPVLLVLDGHYSHTRNVEVIELGRANNVHIISLPPHSSHRIQPLHVSFMGPFKTYYAQEVENWTQNHRDRTLSVYCLARIFGQAYERAATMHVAVNGFRKTGLVPIDRYVFNDEDFEARIGADASMTSPAAASPIPHTSCTTPVGLSTSLDPTSKTPQTPVTPFSDLCDLSPPPLQQPQPSSSRAGKPEHITGTPYKQKLHEQKEKVKENPNKAKKQLFKPNTKTKKKAKVDYETEDESDVSVTSGESELSSENELSCDDSPHWKKVQRQLNEHVVVKYDKKILPGDN